jgi:hypothetical protein
MEKKDCLVAIFGCGEPQAQPRDVLRQARIKSRKLLLVSTCGEVAQALPLVRQIASDNMDFPVRHYHRVDPTEAAALENCATYEILNL